MTLKSTACALCHLNIILFDFESIRVSYSQSQRRIKKMKELKLQNRNQQQKLLQDIRIVIMLSYWKKLQTGQLFRILGLSRTSMKSALDVPVFRKHLLFHFTNAYTLQSKISLIRINWTKEFPRIRERFLLTNYMLRYLFKFKCLHHEISIHDIFSLSDYVMLILYN